MHFSIKRDVESTVQNVVNLVFTAGQYFSHWSRLLVTQNHVISWEYSVSPRNNYKCVDTKSL